MRIIDVHCHPGTQEMYEAWKPYYEALAKYWGKELSRVRTDEEMIREFVDDGVQVLLIGFDTETTTGLPRVSNEYIASLIRKYPNTVIGGWAGVDPWKGEIAIREAELAIRKLGLIGLKFHPIMQRFYPNDKRFYPLWEKMVELKAPVMLHTGTIGLGAGTPGGMGLHLKYARPIPYIDDLAADFPDLTIVCDHPAVPWTDEMIAVAIHKSNVFWELSSWGPKYFPAALKHDISRRLQDKVMFGSDYPYLSHKRLLTDWEAEGYKEEILEKVYYKNAQRVLKLA